MRGGGLIASADDPALTGSSVKFVVEAYVNGRPYSGLKSVTLNFPYIKITELGHKSQPEGASGCSLTENSAGNYSYSGKVTEIINTLSGPKSCYVNASIRDERGVSHKAASAHETYVDENNTMHFVLNFNFDEPTRKELKTPDWKSGAIYCFENATTTLKSGDGEFYDHTQTCSTEKLSYEDIWEENSVDYNTLHIFANGGKLDTYGGASKNTKVLQLTLWENFAGKLIDSTKSKQINWIVTETKTLPKSFKQKSYTKYCSVTKGKLTAVYPGVSYVWACRVDPEDGNLIVPGETCCLKVEIHDAPVKIMASTTPKGPSLTQVNVNVGQCRQIYLDFMSKNSQTTGVPPLQSVTVEVVKGQEYVAVAPAAYSGLANYSSKITDVTNGSFYLLGLSTNKKTNKPINTQVVVTSTYSSTKLKLTVKVANGIVEVEQNPAPINISVSKSSNQVIVINSDIIKSYIKPSSLKFFPDDDEMKDMPTTDVPKLFATTDSVITEDKIYNSSGKTKSVKFRFTKSKSINPLYKEDELTLRIMKNAKPETGNIIIVYNLETYLVIPYTIS